MSAIIYRTAAVTPGRRRARPSSTRRSWANASEPIAQTFTPVGGGQAFTVVANHFKSKSGDEAEPADGQGLVQRGPDRAGGGGRGVRHRRSRRPRARTTSSCSATSTPTREEDPIDVLTAPAWSTSSRRARRTTTPTRSTASSGRSTTRSRRHRSRRGSPVRTCGTSTHRSGRACEYVRAVRRPDERLPVQRPRPDRARAVRAGGAAATVDVHVLAINDFHGRLRRTTRRRAPRCSRVRSTRFRAANPNTLFVSAGRQHRRVDLHVLRAGRRPDDRRAQRHGPGRLGDSGTTSSTGAATDLDDRVEPLVDFPYLAANVYDRATGLPAYAGVRTWRRPAA